MADVPRVEPKVTAATGGAITAPALGALIVWIIAEFTAIDMPFNIGEVVGALVLAGGGALVAGWAKRSSTSATSEAFDRSVAAQAQTNVTPDKIYGGETGLVTLEWLAVGILACLVVALLFGWDILSVSVGD